jgi:phage nucleotide-binding protein
MAIKKRKSNPTQFGDIKSKIAPVSELASEFSSLIYGRSGTGKTAVSSSWPKPMLLVDIREKGTDTIAKVPGIDVISIEEWAEIEQVYWYLKSNESKYKTVSIDQISQMQDLAMAEIKGTGKEESDILSRRDWGQIAGLMKTWLYNYRDLTNSGIYVVFIAHERTNSADESVEDQIDPSIGARLMPSLASAVNGAVSVIGNTFIREEYTGQGKDKERAVKYCMRIGPHAYYTTKIRRPIDFVAPEFIVNPTFDKITKIIRGERSEPKRKVHK